MVEKLTVAMKSWIEQDYQDICESPAEYGLGDVYAEFDKVLDLIVEDVNAKFELKIPHELIESFTKNIQKA